MQKYKDEESATLLHIHLVTQTAKNVIYFCLKLCRLVMYVLTKPVKNSTLLRRNIFEGKIK